jgi:glycosyltransferase involved in cell wall biosynthesis
MSGHSLERPGPSMLVTNNSADVTNSDRSVLLSVVVPCMNEAEVVQRTHQHLVRVLEQAALRFEIIFVDDGSNDATPELLRAVQSSDPRVRVIRLSRNFGHQVAITAGLEHASGDAVVVIDSDLQDPPEVILEFVSKWFDGYDVVYGVRRGDGIQEGVGESFLSIFQPYVGHADAGGHRRFPVDGSTRGECISVDAGARPVCARNGELAGIFSGCSSLSPSVASCG